jgi:hypothetical protein
MEIVPELALPLYIPPMLQIRVHGMLSLKIVVIFRQSAKGQQEVLQLNKTKFHILVYCPWDGQNWVYYAVTNQCYRVCLFKVINIENQKFRLQLNILLTKTRSVNVNLVVVLLRRSISRIKTNLS